MNVLKAVQPSEEGSRTKLLWMVVLLTTAYLVWRFPEQGDVLLSKLNRVALGAVLGVTIDRVLFHYARPTRYNPVESWMLRRAGFAIAGMLAAALAT